MSVPSLTIELRLENDQEGNTWFSNAALDGELDIQIHMSREVWVAGGGGMSALGWFLFGAMWGCTVTTILGALTIHWYARKAAGS